MLPSSGLMLVSTYLPTYKLHGVTSQKNDIGMLIAMKTLNVIIGSLPQVLVSDISVLTRDYYYCCYCCW
jgi:hypothetical protein